MQIGTQGHLWHSDPSLTMAQNIPVGDATFNAKLAQVDNIVDDPDLVVADIYDIFDAQTNKHYIGQAWSHRLNHGRYRPYGFVKRFKSHLSQARCNSACKPCYELHTAIRAHLDDFSVKLLMRCPKEDADQWERHFVQVYNSCWPHGYNQTTGGKGNTVVVMHNPGRDIPAHEHVPRLATDPRGEDTKAKIADGIRKFHEERPEVSAKMTACVQKQHSEKKFATGMAFKIDPANLENYLSLCSNSVQVKFERTRDGKKVSFYSGKNETREETIERAREYLRELVRRQAAQTESA